LVELQTFRTWAAVMKYSWYTYGGRVLTLKPCVPL
jgi:hypothetical protein